MAEKKTGHKEARTVKEALIAEMLGDIDIVLARVEALPAKLLKEETKLLGTVAALEAAGDNYREAVGLFTEQAKTDIKEYLDRKTAEALTKTTEEQKAALQEAARYAFRSEAFDKAAELTKTLEAAAKEYRRTAWVRLVEHTVTMLVTAAIMYLLLR